MGVLIVNRQVFYSFLIAVVFSLITPFSLFSQQPYTERYDQYGRYYSREPRGAGNRDRSYSDRYGRGMTESQMRRRDYQRAEDEYLRYYRWGGPGFNRWQNPDYYDPYRGYPNRYYDRRDLEENPYPSEELQTNPSQYESGAAMPATECIRYGGAGRVGGSSHQLRFYNTCPERVWAKVCIQERPGNFKLHNSATRIPGYGSFTIFTHEGTPPLSVDWSSSLGVPPDPGQCGQINRTSS